MLYDSAVDSFFFEMINQNCTNFGVSPCLGECVAIPLSIEFTRFWMPSSFIEHHHWKSAQSSPNLILQKSKKWPRNFQYLHFLAVLFPSRCCCHCCFCFMNSSWCSLFFITSLFHHHSSSQSAINLR